MRRLLPLVLAIVLAVLLLAPAAVAATTPTSPDAAVVVLAAEGGEAEPAGVEPRKADDTENSNRPTEYEPPFLINAAVGLTALLLVLVVGLGGLYWLLVQRPRTSSQA